MSFSSRIHQSLLRNPGIEAKFLALATVGLKEGIPSCRTVVFRNFLNESIVLYTDALSQKVKELEKNENVEICWYFRVTREQYRIRGACTIFTDLAYKKTCWSKMAQSSKEQYLLVTDNLESNYIPPDGDTLVWNEEREKRAFERFTILIIEPKNVEYLDLTSKPPVPISIPI